MSLTNWMQAISDSAAIGTFTIPGFHDSAAYVQTPGIHISVTIPFVCCQQLNIAQQLAVGCRFLDIRCRQVGDLLLLFHGIVPLMGTFADVIAACTTFLRENPGECILMSLRQEGDGVDARGST